MKQQLKIAVIGVGHLGKHHVEHFCSIKNIVLVGVYDIDKVRAEKISDKYDITSFSTIDELLKSVDAVSIVTPTEEHKKVAIKCIENKKHVFIEKPITASVADADQLIAMAEKNKTIIQKEKINEIQLNFIRIYLNLVQIIQEEK